MATAAVQMRATSGEMSGLAVDTEHRASVIAAATEQARAACKARPRVGTAFGVDRRDQPAGCAGRGYFARGCRRCGVNIRGHGGPERCGRAHRRSRQADQLRSPDKPSLALNATIEAAAAPGKAGRGFAVVPSEVKRLPASPEAEPTRSGRKSRTFRTRRRPRSRASPASPADRTDHEASTAIAAAIEEQGAATQEITSSTQRAAQSAHEVSSNITGVTERVVKPAVRRHRADRSERPAGAGRRAEG